MSAKKRFLTLQYRMKRITAQDVANMIKIGSITKDDVPDALKDEVKKLLSEHSEQSEPTSDSK